MKSQDNPEVKPLNSGNTFKVLQVTGRAGMKMPEHVSTGEAVVIVQKGSATIKMNGIDHVLQLNESFIVPAGIEHELSITEEFQAVVIMKVESEIKFTNI